MEHSGPQPASTAKYFSMREKSLSWFLSLPPREKMPMLVAFMRWHGTPTAGPSSRPLEIKPASCGMWRRRGRCRRLLWETTLKTNRLDFRLRVILMKHPNLVILCLTFSWDAYGAASIWSPSRCRDTSTTLTRGAPTPRGLSRATISPSRKWSKTKPERIW